MDANGTGAETAAVLGWPRGTVNQDAADHLKVAVIHAPYQRVLDYFTADDPDLILAGHTHGGQVCIPGYGALVSNCDLPTWRARGLSMWENQGHEVPLNVSAGIGTSRFAPIRIACPPEAAALPEAVCTAWSNLVDAGRLRAGEWVLVQGGSGGVGSIAIQLAEHVGSLGAHVSAVALRSKISTRSSSRSWRSSSRWCPASVRAPMLKAAMIIRSTLSPRISCFQPWPAVPTTAEAGTRAPVNPTSSSK